MAPANKTSCDAAVDKFNLERFVQAQDTRGVYEKALAELKAGQKKGHWMWYIFPQIAGLGKSAIAQKFAISSQEEAQAYLEHKVLGARLLEVTRVVADGPAASVEDLMKGMPIDALKLQSSMTLFAHVSEDEVFKQVLDRYFGGEDTATMNILVKE
ncbi:hypothetical protein NKR23_g401 [Pleurostoma richardsiae]|uniref:Calpastatin n=1 Tax=Pleurostoma richardsiae TaxID=41990 RepID=A0AA38S6U4_9PEZI|nr:hypothetical protein NKR23_g401 [Pleurostoma richardsiae]